MKELLNNVSLFWSKYFKDSEVLYSLLEGALSRVADFKQTSASQLVSTGLDSIPTKLRCEVSLIELEDSKFLAINALAQTFLIYDLGVSTIRTLPFLLPYPDSEEFLEQGVDYVFFRGNDSTLVRGELLDQLEDDHYYLLFSADPRENSRFRSESEYVEGNFVVSLNTAPTDILSGEEADILDSEGATLKRCRVAYFDTDTKEVFLHISTPLVISEAAKEFKVVSTNVTYEISQVSEFIYQNSLLQTWAPNTYTDPKILERTYAHLHSTIFEESSEKYRNFLVGLSLLRTRQFSVTNIKAGVCLCSGVPVFLSSYEDGERLIRADTSAKCHTVYTTSAAYEIPKELTLRQEILDDVIEISINGVTDTLRVADHPQTFEFSAFDSLIEDVIVYNGNGEDTSWWDRGLPNSKFLEVPQQLMLTEPLLRRTVINHVYANVLGEVTEAVGAVNYLLPPAAIGDYGISIGDVTRNTVAYNLFKDFLKHHFCFIEISREFIESTEIAAKPSILADLRRTLSGACLPGSVVLLGPSLAANLDDVDHDGIPDIIDPEIT